MRWAPLFIILIVYSCTETPKTPLPKVAEPPAELLASVPEPVDSAIDLKENPKYSQTEWNKTQELGDEQAIEAFFNKSLGDGYSYELLRQLADGIGGRLSGSPEAARAVEWAYQALDTMGIERVWKQEVLVPHWVRGEIESAKIIGSDISLACCALGGSVPTAAGGISAEVIEVRRLEELEQLGTTAIKNKIVFYNRPMNPIMINTFHAYGDCVDQRWAGAMEAAKFGAKAVLVRSMNLRMDDYPHTGSMGYEEGVEKIPAAAISTIAATTLSKELKQNPNLQVHFEQECQTLPDALSHNVIGEIRGSEYPDEIILVGGHLDAWDNGDGAHDDGAGVVHSMEVLRLFKALGIRPKRTLRAVLFMNEENGLRGAKRYAELALKNGEKHIAAIESDRGGFTPRGFTVDGSAEQLAFIQSWRPMLEKYGLYELKAGGGGADISPLKQQGTLLLGFIPDSQRYFDYHHSPSDKFESVNKRELEMGAAALAAMVYLLSENGVANQPSQ